MNVAPVFSLTLLGSPRIADGDGAVLSGRAVQRHRVALLALLACAHPRGQGRDRLMAYLWPERDIDGARQLLNQAVYVLRRALGEDALVSEAEELRLNVAVVRADVVQFEAALERGDPARAVSLHAGPLLDGFFLGGAPEFDQWLERERNRLGARYAGALEALAEEAGARGDVSRAVEWWKARAAHDPYDSRVAIRLMRALDDAGNRAGALQHARIHQQLLEQEFGAEPPPEMSALRERLRSEPLAAVPPVPDPGAPAETAISAGPDNVAGAPASLPHVPTTPVRTGASPRRARASVRYGVAAVLLIAAMPFTIELVRSTRAATTARADPSIAVLPLENLGTDPRDATLVAGMTDGVTAKLAQNGGLRVMDGASVRLLAGRVTDGRAIADSLGVDHLLEGGVEKVGDELHLRMRLVLARDGSTLWSETYDREMRDVFAVQDDIARGVAGALGVTLPEVAAPALSAHRTTSIAAYELYLRGTDRRLLRNDSTAREGLEYFRQAVALDSMYAAAWAGLARMYGRVTLGAGREERERYVALGREAARRAVALDDSLAEAHATLGVSLMRSFDFHTAERHLRRAIDLDTTRALTHEWLVTLYLWTGRPADALAHAHRALQLEPLSPSAHAELANALAGNDRCDEALKQLQPLEALQPPLLRVAPLAALCHVRARRWSEAIALLRPSAEQNISMGLAQLGFTLALAGQREEALHIRNVLLERWRADEAGAYEVALQFAGSGDIDETFLWLDRALDDGSLNGLPGNAIYPAIITPAFAELHADPRFESLRRRTGAQNP